MINNNVKNISLDSLNYKGAIKVQITKGNKVIRETQFKNNGRWPLFKHLVDALSGNYTQADLNRPILIGIYSVPYNLTNDGFAPEINDGGDPKNYISTYAKKDYLKVAVAGMFMTEPVPSVKTNKGIGSASVTYKFIIPFTSLLVDPTETRDPWNSEEGWQVDPLNLVCLYGRANAWQANSATESSETGDEDTYGNPNAYFFVTEDNKKMVSLLPKDITGNSSEYSLVVKWTLTFKNEGTTVIPTAVKKIKWVNKIYHAVYGGKDESCYKNSDTYEDRNCAYNSIPQFTGYIPKYDESDPNEYKLKKMKYIPKNVVETGLPKYTYVFAGWTPDFTLVTDDTTYTASYWKVNSSGNIIGKEPVTEYDD